MDRKDDHRAGVRFRLHRTGERRTPGVDVHCPNSAPALLGKPAGDRYGAPVKADWWVPLAAAGIALLAGMVGGWVTHLFTSKREKDQFKRLTARQDVEWERATARQADEWQRQRADKLLDVRRQLYLDLMEFITNIDQILAHDPVDDTGLPRQIPVVMHPARLTARVKLYADQPLVDAWALVERTYADVVAEAWNLGEHEISFETNNAARQAVAQLQAALRERISTIG
jgi:hypothetical protein